MGMGESVYEQGRNEKLKDELRKVEELLNSPNVADVDPAAVEAALSRRGALVWMLARVEQEREVRAAQARQQKALEEDELRRLRERLAIDGDLRAAVRSRNSADEWNRTWKRPSQNHGPLPGGFSDDLRRRLSPEEYGRRYGVKDEG